MLPVRPTRPLNFLLSVEKVFCHGLLLLSKYLRLLEIVQYNFMSDTDSDKSEEAVSAAVPSKNHSGISDTNSTKAEAAEPSKSPKPQILPSLPRSLREGNT